MARKRTSKSRAAEPQLAFHERVIVGYHGCERGTARRVLLGEDELAKSTNDYDWLGHGIYFWEHGLARAQEFAEEKRERGELDDPVVIGAYLRLGQCLDLTDVWATEMLARSFEELQAHFAKQRKPMPVNAKTRGSVAGDWMLRRLDCAVVNLCTANSDQDARALGRPYGFDTVRGVFEEGPPAFPGAGIRAKSHVQIAVRNPASVLGLFRPTGYTL